MRRLLLLVVGLAVVAAATPSLGAAQPRLKRELLVYSYDGYGPALLSVEGRVDAHGRPGYLAGVSADDEDGLLVPFFPDVVELAEGQNPPHTYGAVGSRDLCASPVLTCRHDASEESLSFGISFSVGRSPRPIHLRMLLALEGTSVSAHSVQLGWKVRARRTGFARVVTGGTGLRAEGTGVEALPAAALPGGRRGSIAIAVPPCDQVGVGSVSLAGGAQTRSELCPSYPFAAAARAGTRWVLSGTAAGVTAYRTRLLVFDL